MNKMKILVTFANEWDMTADGGEKGCTINYFFFGENGEMMKANSYTKGAIGYQRAKVSLDYYKRDKLRKVPAIYDATMEMSVGSDGKPVMKVVDVDYVGDVAITLSNSVK